MDNFFFINIHTQPLHINIIYEFSANNKTCPEIFPQVITNKLYRIHENVITSKISHSSKMFSVIISDGILNSNFPLP